jgi:hypothetical protein
MTIPAMTIPAMTEAMIKSPVPGFRRGLLATGFLLSVALGPAWGEASWETSIYPEDQLFPSFLISTATAGVPEDAKDMWDVPQVGDANGVIGALVHDVRKGEHVRVTVKANAMMEESTFEGVVRKTRDDLLVHPKIKYRYEALAKVHQQRPLNVSIETWIDDESLGEQTVTVDLRSINDCLFAVLNDDGEMEFDANWNFAAYVNENHPWVDEILREALDTGVVNAFDGYQSGKPEDVILQIYAIWNVMQRRGMHYSNITTTAVESDTVLSQHVRLLDESVKSHQANCVDGSVLLAAVLRKIGLRTFLVLVPGHMFLAVDLEDDDDDSMVGIETTMMGNDDLGHFDKLRKISAGEREKLKNQASFKTFEAAVDTGTAALDEDAKHFDDEDDSDYQLIDLAEARSEGIMPLGYEK